MKKTTLKDIADALSLSVSTVSRAMNDKDEIEASTRKKVKQKAQELGYRPNINARALRGKGTGLFGVVIDDNANPFYAEVVKGMEREARKRGLHLLLANTAADLEEEEFAIEFLQHRGVDGILIAPVSDENPARVSQIKVPFVIVGRHFIKCDFCEVYNDEVTGGYLATRRLLSIGKSRILIMLPEMTINPVRGRLRGYRNALQEAGRLKDDGDLVRMWSPEEVRPNLRKLLHSSTKFDGIVAYNDLYALEAISLLRSEGIRIPDDIAVVGYDDIPFAAYFFPSLTTIALDKIWMGKEAVRMLSKVLEGKTIRKRQLVQTPALIIRDSA